VVTGPQSKRLFFVGLSQAVSVQSVTKKLDDHRSNLTREIENIPDQMLKDRFFEFSKNVRIIDFRW
jgi:hypothetical protein